MLKKSIKMTKKIFLFIFRKVVLCFCLDLTAVQTSKLLGINRNTINKYFNMFKQRVYSHQVDQMKKFVGEVKVGGVVMDKVELL